VAAEAAAALGRLGPAAAAATDALVRAAGHMNPLVRRNVAAALVGDDPDRVVPTLLTLADDPEQEVRLAAISSLGHFSEQSARDRVRAALADDDPAIRLAAVRALSTNGESLEDLTPILLPLLNDPSEGVVVEVVATLGRMDDLPEVVTRRLEGLLQRDAEAVQLAAVQVLGQFAPTARRATPGLLRALERGPAAVREQALRVLLQAETPDLTGAYLAALHDSEVGVRRLASAGLILSAPLPAETLPALAEGMKDPDAQVRSNLAMVLSKQEQLPLGVVPTLLRCLAEPDDGLRLNALRALQNEPERLTEVLPRLLADPNGQVAFLAASCALRRDARNPEAGVILLRALSSETVRDRRQAVEVLEQLGAEAARFADAVRRQAALETDAELREAMLGLPALVAAAEPS
jgi:HEAT repeat protein